MKEQSASITQLYLLKELEVKKIGDDSFVAVFPPMDDAMLKQILPIMDSIGGRLDEEQTCFAFKENPMPKIEALLKERIYTVDDTKFNGYWRYKFMWKRTTAQWSEPKLLDKICLIRRVHFLCQNIQVNLN